MLDPLYVFVFAGLFSPGPNVVMLTTSGARFGFRRTVPHLLGVVIGVGVIAGLTGLGIGALLLTLPRVEVILKTIAAGWILWMAWRLWTSPDRPDAAQNDKPLSFWQAVLFQWVNPKIWAVALAASTAYAAGLEPVIESVRLALVFSGTNLFVCLFWTMAGSLLAYLLGHPSVWRVFIRMMAVALAATTAMVFL